MDKKQLVIYVSIVIVGLGIMVGVVMFLRARNLATVNADQELLQKPPTSQPAAAQNQIGGKIKSKFTPIDATPPLPAWKPGDPVPPPTVEPVLSNNLIPIQ